MNREFRDLLRQLDGEEEVHTSQLDVLRNMREEVVAKIEEEKKLSEPIDIIIPNTSEAVRETFWARLKREALNLLRADHQEKRS